jgi:hypothetical protein
MQDLSKRVVSLLYATAPIAIFGMSISVHVLLHVASLVLAVMLATVSVASYHRVLKPSLLFVSLAFLTLASEEFIVLAQALSWMGPEIFSMAGSPIELSHLLTLGSLSLFASGLIRRE